MYIQPSVLLSTVLYASMNVYKTVCLSFYLIVNAPIRASVIVYVSVRLSVCQYGKTICLAFFFIVNAPIRANVIVYVSVLLSVYQFVYCLSMCSFVRPSVKCKSTCMRISVVDCMLLYRCVCFLFVRRSVRPSTHLVVGPSV